ncbi:NAD(P)-binding domain-containing protein [Nostoc sp.]|uniref:NAD(P)-binding domain-containing protein n=1 Tax=Nostoc sp. TaxID=1180 RepID=UPI002FF5BA71
MTEYVETVILGGGQSGLSLSYYLTQQNRKHIVLEQGQIAESWRKRWDSLHLVTPNWQFQIPGFPCQSSDPNGFLPKNEVVKHFDQYVKLFKLPLRCGIQVTSVQQKLGSDSYLVRIGDEVIEAANVVVATGACQHPKIPLLSIDMPMEIFQIHSSEYRNPQKLPPGDVLVVGTGQSGCQIAEELNQSGRKVYLSVGSCGRMPRRYRGQDVTWWVKKFGMYEDTVDCLPSLKERFLCNPHLSGKDGGHEINLHHLAKDGVILLGRLQKLQGNKLTVAPDLKENLAKADAFATKFQEKVDEYIQKTGIEVPEDSTYIESEVKASFTTPENGQEAEPILELDIKACGIKNVIWATGYKVDFSWVQMPIFQEDGYPVHERGVTEYPGLYFLGLHWLYKRKSSLLFGVGEDAAFIALKIEYRMKS